MRISEVKRVKFYGIKFVLPFIKNLIGRKIKFLMKFYWQIAILICRMKTKDLATEDTEFAEKKKTRIYLKIYALFLSCSLCPLWLKLSVLK